MTTEVPRGRQTATRDRHRPVGNQRQSRHHRSCSRLARRPPGPPPQPTQGTKVGRNPGPHHPPRAWPATPTQVGGPGCEAVRAASWPAAGPRRVAQDLPTDLPTEVPTESPAESPAIGAEPWLSRRSRARTRGLRCADYFSTGPSARREVPPVPCPSRLLCAGPAWRADDPPNSPPPNPVARSPPDRRRARGTPLKPLHLRPIRTRSRRSTLPRPKVRRDAPETPAAGPETSSRVPETPHHGAETAPDCPRQTLRRRGSAWPWPRLASAPPRSVRARPRFLGMNPRSAPGPPRMPGS
jgi:hypothetical protein